MSPANLHLAANSPASTLPAPAQRVEQKFFVLPHRAGLALALVRRVCRPDPDHPQDQVNSLYFDTIDLDQHERSLSGEFSKDKIRIRWYGEEHDPHRIALDGGPGPRDREADSPAAATGDRHISIWLELKSRRGFAATKQRRVLEVHPADLAFCALSRGIVPANLLLQTMAGFGFFARGPLRPVVVVSYWRHRFIEPRNGYRISLDSRIRSSMVMPGMGRGERGLELPGMVVEVKGPRFEVPAALRQLAEIGAGWTRYSKYSSSLDGHLATRGSVSRLWPSGMMDKQTE